MNRLIICVFAVVSLNSFGAAGPGTALISQRYVRPNALQRLITVVQGPSKMPFSMAYRSTQTNRVYACLVASRTLNESFSPDVAHDLVDACVRRGLHAMPEVIQSKITAKTLSKEILRNALAVFFVLDQDQYTQHMLSTFMPEGKRAKEYRSVSLERSVSLRFDDSDLTVHINYDEIVEHFPKSSMSPCGHRTADFLCELCMNCSIL